jgi:IS30 family transposase
MDNDQSFALHYKLHPMGVKTYFTHPYSSQEKGSVENRIGQIRRIYPKKTNFEEVTPQQVRRLENWLNNRPMRMFNYRTPNEVDALSRSLHL